MVALLVLGLALVALLAVSYPSLSRPAAARLRSYAFWALLIVTLLVVSWRAGLYWIVLPLGGAAALVRKLAPALWSALVRLGVAKAAQAGHAKQASGRAAPSGSTSAAGMSRAEALEVLGLDERADKAEVVRRYKHLIRAAHPDQGGSDYLARKLNEARDVLLRHRS